MIGSVRYKLLAILTFILMLMSALAIFGITRIDRVAQTANLMTTHRLPINGCSENARLALVSGASYMDRVLLIQSPEEAGNIRVLEGQFRASMIDFDMFIKAMIWGSESEEFRKSSGGQGNEASAAWHGAAP